MKTHANFYRIHYQEWLFLLIVGIMTLFFGGCTEDPDPIPIPIVEQLTVAERYIGQYELMDNKGSKKTIAIEPFLVVNQDDFVPNQVGVYQVYVSNLVAGNIRSIVANWNGDSFIMDVQEIRGTSTGGKISGRLSLFEGELSVTYHIQTPQEVKTYAQRYRKMD